LDACLVIYLLEGHPRWAGAVAAALANAADARFGISPLVKCECLVGPIKRGDPVLQRAYTELFRAVSVIGDAGTDVFGGDTIACAVWD
jgi:hypothetical protein